MSNSNTQLVDLSHQGLITVTGPDAAKFLQGQVTCDITDLEQASRLGAHCTHKGRAISSFRAARLADEKIALRLPKSILASAQQALAKYIVFSKAELADASDDYSRIGLAGPTANALLTEHLAAPPSDVQGVCHLPNGCIIKLSEQRFECWIAAADGKTLWDKLQPACSISDAEAWTLLDIRDGYGEVRPETLEAFIPQLLNYQLIDGISFQKGCYSGQEVIARMHYRGKLKRQMFRVSFPSGEALPLPGTDIYTDKGTQSVGTIVIAAPAEESRAEALAVITRDAALSDSAYLDLTQTTQLKVLPLPYSLNEKDA